MTVFFKQALNKQYLLTLAAYHDNGKDKPVMVDALNMQVSNPAHQKALVEFFEADFNSRFCQSCAKLYDHKRHLTDFGDCYQCQELRIQKTTATLNLNLIFRGNLAQLETIHKRLENLFDEDSEALSELETVLWEYLASDLENSTVSINL